MYPRSRVKSAACGHPYCYLCWAGITCVPSFCSLFVLTLLFNHGLLCCLLFYFVVVSIHVHQYSFLIFNNCVKSRSSILFYMLGYIGTSINDGPGCLGLRCPDPTCGAAIGQDMINLLASDEDKAKYDRYLLRSYIEDNKKVCCRLLIWALVMMVKEFIHFFVLPTAILY